MRNESVVSSELYWITSVILLALPWLAPATCVADPISISLQQVASGLSSPVQVTSARDDSNRLFIVEQAGLIRIFQSGAIVATPFLDITSRVLSGGERGLLSVAFHPSYHTNRRFFVYYTQQTDGALVIAEFQTTALNPNQADPASERQLLVIPHPTYGNHNGGQLQFGPDGYLYAGTGDGGGGGDPFHAGQDIHVLLGKILRIDVDGALPYAIPPDNPYVGIDGLDEIYAIGVRNPWRFSFDRLTGTMYVGDVGQGAWEEVDTVTLGGNYGWSVMEGPVCYPPGGACNTAGLILPIDSYPHTGGNCSITGGYVYRGASYSSLRGTYFYADYCTGIIWGRTSGTTTQLLDTGLNPSSFGEDESGELYVVSLGGTINRIIAPVSIGCTLTCPADISVVDADGNGSEIVSYDSPGSSGTCGVVSCVPPAGSAFPLGTTTVACTSSAGGGVCSFSVTVLASDGPVVSECSPSGAPRGKRISVLVHGSGFVDGARASLGKGIKIIETEFHYSGELDVTARIQRTARIGTRNVVVHNPDGRSAICKGCFRVNAARQGHTSVPVASRSDSVPTGPRS